MQDVRLRRKKVNVFATGGPPGVLAALVIAASAWMTWVAPADAGWVLKEVPAGEAYALIRDRSARGDLVVLDVRTKGEFDAERIPGAMMVDYRSGTFRKELAALDRDKAYLVYCRTGNRSGSSLSVMKDLGFGTVYHLTGGIVRWKDEGLPTTK